MIDLKRVFIKGGILSPSELKQIIDYAESLGLDALHFGSRQDIIFPEHTSNTAIENQFPKLSTSMISDATYHNIVCSYVSADIFLNTSWLSGVTYLYIIENFKRSSSTSNNSRRTSSSSSRATIRSSSNRPALTNSRPTTNQRTVSSRATTSSHSRATSSSSTSN